MSSKPAIWETLGALYVGATIAAILFGITNLQTVIYYKKYPTDWWVYRYSVALLWVLDALHVALSTHSLCYYLIDMFGELLGGLVHIVWSFKLQLDVNMFIVVYVQGLYAIRPRKRPCCLLIMIYIDMAKPVHSRTALSQSSPMVCVLGCSSLTWYRNIHGLRDIYDIQFLEYLQGQNGNLHRIFHVLCDRSSDSPHDVLLPAKEQGEDMCLKHGISSSQSNADRAYVRVSYKCIIPAYTYHVYCMARHSDLSRY